MRWPSACRRKSRARYTPKRHPRRKDRSRTQSRVLRRRAASLPRSIARTTTRASQPAGGRSRMARSRAPSRRRRAPPWRATARATPSSIAQLPSARSGRRLLAARRGDALDLQRMQTATGRPQHAKTEAVERDRLAALREPAERFQHESADGVEFLILERRAEVRIEIVDLRLRLDA